MERLQRDLGLLWGGISQRDPAGDGAPVYQFRGTIPWRDADADCHDHDQRDGSANGNGGDDATGGISAGGSRTGDGTLYSEWRSDREPVLCGIERGSAKRAELSERGGLRSNDTDGHSDAWIPEHAHRVQRPRQLRWHIANPDSDDDSYSDSDGHGSDSQRPQRQRQRQPTTPTPTPTPTPNITPSSTPAAQALNLSTRLRVQTGDNVGIGGFIITGSAPKQVLLRGIGPSLTAFGVPDALADPVMELHGPAGFTTITNDNWRDTQQAAIQATGLPPTNDLESAILATLNPGPYTAIVKGKNNTTGVALVEVYDLDQAAASKLANISTRAFVEHGFQHRDRGLHPGGNSGR